MSPPAPAGPTFPSRLRPVVQILTLGGFVFLALAGRFGWSSPLPPDFFLRFDPLAWLAASVASRTPAPGAGPPLGLLLGTAILGPVFCGWGCPLGTVMDGLGPLRRRGPRLPVTLGGIRF